MAIIHPLVIKNANQFRLVGPAEHGPNMRADLTKVRQILFNLLSNACKFTDHGTITLEMKRVGGQVLFKVSDTGIGMTPEQMDRLFRGVHPGRRLRLTRALRRHRAGAGHQPPLLQYDGTGDIHVESEMGQGTTFFTIVLPANVVDPKERRSRSRKPLRRAIRSLRPGPASYS